MKKLLFFVLLLVYGSSFSQNYKITYLKSSNGSLIENQDPVLVFTNSEVTQIGSQSIFNGKADFPNEIIFVDRKTNSFSQVADLDATKTINSKDSVSLGKQTFEYLNDTKKILGYNCKKAKTIVNSNNIELWYTNELKVKGAPTILGQNLGLVLEMVRNGNFVIKATKIERIKMFPTDPDLSKSIDMLTYKDLLWKSRFTTINVFKDQIINFSETSKSNAITRRH